MATKEELWLENFKETLSAIDSTLNWVVNFDSQIIKGKTVTSEQLKITSTDVNIVLTKLPSSSYGSDITTQSMQITAMTMMTNKEAVFTDLAKYQAQRVANKYFLSPYYISESWYSPTISENFIESSINKYVTITMDGSIAFAPMLLDVTSLKFNTLTLKPIQLSITATADTISSRISGESSSKAINRSITMKIDFKAIASNDAFGVFAKNWMFGLISKNTAITITLTFSTGQTVTKTMIMESCNYLTTDGTLPVVTATIVEKL